MHRERDSRGRFVSRGRSSILTSPLTPTRPRSVTPSSKIRIPSFSGRHRLPKVNRYEIQPRDSPTSSTESIFEEPTSPIEGVSFLSLTREFFLGQELEVPGKAE